jgi:hypothetical protein
MHLRFVDHGELRYSLRSVEQNLSGFDRIFIFTNTAPPEWLNTDHPRVRLVRHEEVIDRRYLPLYHSNAIESFLHHIPGISRQFLYFNDDFILQKPMHVADFFRNRQPVFRCHGEMFATNRLRDINQPLLRELQNGMRLLKKVAGVPSTVFTLTHSAYPMDVEIMRHIERDFGEAVERLRCSRFRSSHSIPLVNLVYPYVCIGMKKGALRISREHFIRSDDEKKLQERPHRLGGRLLNIKRKMLARWNLRRAIVGSSPSTEAEFACVNEGIDASVSQLLAEKFPIPSSFERQ